MDQTYPAAVGIICTAYGSAATFPISTSGAPIYIWYRVIDGDTGVFTYAIDNGGPVALTTALFPSIDTGKSTAHSVALVRVPIVAGSHVVHFSQTTGTRFTTRTGGTMAIIAVGTVNAPRLNPLPYVVVGDVPSLLDDEAHASALVAYRLDIAENIRLLAGDGLNITLAPVGKYLKATTAAGDMADFVHPNDKGNAEMFAAFMAGIQMLPGGQAVTLAPLKIPACTPLPRKIVPDA